jgi:hypothetical protein
MLSAERGRFGGALADMDGLPFKVYIGDFQVDCFLAAQARRIDQREYDPLFEQGGCCKDCFQLASVEDHRQLGVLPERRVTCSSSLRKTWLNAGTASVARSIMVGLVLFRIIIL